MVTSQPVVMYVARWRKDEYSKWTTRYFDSVEDLNEYWSGFHSILAPSCLKESYKVVYYPLNVSTRPVAEISKNAQKP